MINYSLLFLGIVYTTFLPGLIFVELTLPKFELWKKLPLYFIFSTIISSYFSYFVSLIFGFTQITIFWSVVCFIVIFVILVLKKKINLKFDIKQNLSLILASVLIYLTFFIVLKQGVFTLHEKYFVMAGPNWQDTAMHLSIVESLSQGNFPPQAPYFSGHQLSYYYFADFHAAIITTLCDKFFPQVLIILNSFFAMTFFLSVYALTFSYTSKKSFSFLAGSMALLFGNLGFADLIQKLSQTGENYFAVLTNSSFSSNSEILQMVPMTDFFLQNRPMMVGLPVIVLTVLLLDNRKYFLAGILAAALLKFQLFGFIVAWLFFIPHVNIKNILKFGLPSLILSTVFLFTKTDGRSIFEIFSSTFSWGPWQDHSLNWFLEFVIKDFGIGIFIFVLSFFIGRFVKKLRPLFLISLIIFAIPFVVTFTIYPFDMFKFFYYLIPFICVGLSAFYASTKNQKISLIIFSGIVVISSLTSVNLLVHTYLNKTPAYSIADYKAGLWIREYTPQKTIFVTMPTVHSAPSDIAGRLRVISYINWPYSHGFNTGIDNVFSRVEDVEKVYKTGEVNDVKIKYNAKYIYLGEDESGEFPEVYKKFDNNMQLKKIYDINNIKIYEIL
ncbi:MAG TPA: DUF2298 domain-containing protein [Alphaproteobacteria bacterium]|jgi:uncharacterized membrane protein|nr:DUF2298 domain-containing protein [Alphaproteobacteria bacterium]